MNGSKDKERDDLASSLRKAAELLSPTPNVTPDVPPLPQTAARDNVRSEMARMFAPYPLQGRGRKHSKRQQQQYPESRKPPQLLQWSHRFFCLALKDQDWVPQRYEKRKLYEAGLAEKRITFPKVEDHSSFITKLEEKFPKLAGCGGIELLRTSYTDRIKLELIAPPPMGYNAMHLAEESNLGQALCYIRPIQADLDTSSTGIPIPKGCPKELCHTCGEAIAVTQLREHTENCAEMEAIDEGNADTSGDETEEQLEARVNSKQKEPKRMNLSKKKDSRVVVLDVDDDDDSLPDLHKPLHKPSKDPKQLTLCVKENVTRPCPVCSVHVLVKDLERHADLCCQALLEDSLPGTSGQSNNLETERRGYCESALDTSDLHAQQVHSNPGVMEIKPSTWKAALEQKKVVIQQEDADVWEVAVLRDDLSTTLMAELLDGTDKQWHSKIKVEFMGEFGADIGGLLREMFTLFFRTTPLLEGQVFKISAEALQNGSYRVLGKAFATALVSGHPGPQRLSPLLVRYLIDQRVPDLQGIEVDLAVQNAIEKLRSAPVEDLRSNDEVSDMLQSAGFTKLLKDETRESAVVSLKEYFGFYRYMPPLQHVMEGLELHGIIHLMRQHPGDALIAMTKQDDMPAQVLRAFFLPSYSEDAAQKAKEARLMYNLKRFLTRVETAQVSTMKVDTVEDTSTPMTITIPIVCQAFTGSPSLPLNIESGLVIFDHASERMPVINTCAPSITISNTTRMQDYTTFEDNFVHAIMGSMDFFGVS